MFEFWTAPKLRHKGVGVSDPFAQREIALISVSVGFVNESTTFFEDLVVKHLNVKRSPLKNRGVSVN